MAFSFLTQSSHQSLVHWVWSFHHPGNNWSIELAFNNESIALRIHYHFISSIVIIIFFFNWLFVWLLVHWYWLLHCPAINQLSLTVITPPSEWSFSFFQSSSLATLVISSLHAILRLNHFLSFFRHELVFISFHWLFLFAFTVFGISLPFRFITTISFRLFSY